MKKQPDKTAKKKTGKQTKKNDIKQFPVVGIGASAGGLEEFKKIFSLIPEKSGMAYVLITHLDPHHESMISELVGHVSKIPFQQIKNRQKIKPDNAYVIPPNHHLSIKKDTFYLKKSTDKKPIRFPINHFFKSLAEDRKNLAAGIILSGTGADGTQGVLDINSHGGLTIAQTPETAQFSSMPENAELTGVLNFVLPVAEIPEMLINYSERMMNNPSGNKLVKIDSSNMLNHILTIISKESGFNFHCYKKSTLQRRIERRMGLVHKPDCADYVDFLRENDDEVKKLFQDFLIGVTSFFREADVWEEFQKHISEILLNRNRKDVPFRVWVTGCSTGEEAYTIAILIYEILEKQGIDIDIQIFATDVNEKALGKARRGWYSEDKLEKLSEYQLKHFFVKEKNGYRINSKLRDSVVFSLQNLITDPPFSKLDLISCRNLLIYLEPSIQKKIINLFHFALKKDGLLLLGNSETIGDRVDIFEPLSKSCRIFKSIGPRIPNRVDFPVLSHGFSNNVKTTDHSDNYKSYLNSDLSLLAHRMLIKKHGLAGVLINRKYETLYFSGDTTPYLFQQEGAFTPNLFSMLREGLVTRMRQAVLKAVKSNQEIDVKARVKRKGTYFPVLISVLPLDKEVGGDGLILISFKEPSDLPVTSLNVSEEEESIVNQLEHELKLTKRELQQTIEDMETSSQELKVSNEEIMSMNEELQSSNEELETSKEELQSLNEELSTVNAQLQENIINLEAVNNDLTNLMKITDMAILFLDVNLKIRRFTPAAQKLFRVIPQDLGRSFKDISIRINDKQLYSDIEKILKDQKNRFNEVKSPDGKWYRRKALPYIIENQKSEGIVVVYDDITILKQKNAELEKSQEQKIAILDGLIESVMLIDKDFYVEWANKAITGNLGKTPDEIKGMQCHRVLRGRKQVCKRNCPTVRAFRTGKPQSDELKIKNRIYQVNSIPLFDEKGEVASVIETSMDITLVKNTQQELERKVKERTKEFQKANKGLQKAKEDIAEREERFRTTFEQAAVGIAHVSPEGKWLRVNSKLCKILGYTKREMMKMSYMDITSPEDLKEDQELSDRVLQGDLKTYTVEKRYVCKDGSPKWVNLTVSLVWDSDGDPKHFISVVQDISKRKKMEKEVFDLARFPSENPNPVLRINDKGIIMYANDASKCLLETWQVEENQKLPEEQMNWLKKSIQAEKPVNIEETAEERIFSLCITKVKSAGFINIYGMDITENKKAEEDLRRIQEFENIGRLAGGIAHDFNNLMTGVYGNISLAKMQIGDSHQAFSSLQDAENAMKRATSLTHQLLTFAKGGHPVKTIIDITKVIKEIIKFDLSGSNVKPVFELDKALWQAEVDKGQIQQVISNLAINARQAMPHGGNLFIKVRNAEIEKDVFLNLKAGKYLKIDIEDEGPGIAKKDLPNIFNPYFSTKEMGHGLGLSVVNSIIKKHGGHISVESDTGKGAVFTIYLPAVIKDSNQIESKKNDTELFKDDDRKYRLLVMDDQKIILELVDNILKNYNFEIEKALDGKQAIEKYRKAMDSGNPFDAVILDLTIPGGMGGVETLKEIHKINPEVRAIVSSGYANDPVLSDYEAYGFKAIAAKPYTLKEFLKAIDSAINS